jgi:starch synthase
MSLAVCLVASEVAPLAKTGGLADVAAALTKHLHADGHDARLFMPFYSSIERAHLEHFAIEFLRDVPLQLGPHQYRYSVVTARLPESRVFLYLVDCPALYARTRLYTEDVDEHLRFLVLTHAALESCRRMDWSPNILHCHDWHTAFGPLLLKSKYRADRLLARTKSVLTIHNIGYQGAFPAAAAADVGLGAQTDLLHQDDLRAGYVNSLKHGILFADAITTVSPTYAREICTAEYGMGLQGALSLRGDAVLGILNGADYDHWDPRSDRYLPRHYGPRELVVKAELKREFLARLRLKAGPRTPLIGLVARLTAQKGLELLFDSLPALLARRDACFVAVGSGEQRYESFFAELQQQFPLRVVFRRGYNEELAHWVEAASDLFVMPSRYEPCGLNQMYSMRYGTVPIVRKTGGLADSVHHYDPITRRGTGIVFDDFNSEAMSWALDTALDLYEQPEVWREIMRQGMAENFSWERQGALYVQLYRRLAG